MNYVNNWLYQLTGSFAPGQSTLPLPAAALERLALAEGVECTLTLSASLNPTAPAETEIIRLAGTADGYVIVRGQEGTPEQAWPEGTLIWCTITAAALALLPSIGDVLITVRDPGPRYLLANGASFDAAAHPDLARMLGSGSGSDGWAVIERPDADLDGVATDGAGVWVVAAWDGLYRSTDDAVTWALVDGVPSDRYAVATDGQGTWVTSGVGGTYRSTDNGLSWMPVTGVGGYMTSLVAGHDGVWIGFEGAPSSLSISTDHAETWGLLVTPLTYLNGLATDGNGTWVLLGTNDTGDTGARSADNGGTWDVIAAPGGSFRRAIGTDGNGTWLAHAEMSNGDNIYMRSIDNGATWTEWHLDLGDASSIAVDGDTWVITGGWAEPYGAMSTDGGETWEEIAEFGESPTASAGRDGGTWVAVGPAGLMYRKSGGVNLPILNVQHPLRAYVLAN